MITTITYFSSQTLASEMHTDYIVSLTDTCKSPSHRVGEKCITCSKGTEFDERTKSCKREYQRRLKYIEGIRQ